MSFSSEPTGVVRFENVNFSKFGRPSRERLLQLEKKGRVEIGPGCIKYRHQTEIRSIPITEGGAPLILELCQTFANYFTVSNGINLGFEIVERRPDTVRFFYFTDEDIPDDEFQERLRQTEQGLWNLLAVRSTGQLLALQPPQETVSALAKGNSILHAIDGISALIGTFFRVGARIAFGRWDEKDTSALLGAIRFNEEGAEERAEDLHRLLVEKYTGPALFGINSQQNRPLPPLLEAKPGVQPSTKVRILFLGANSAQEPLALEQEIKRIQNNLQLAKERDNLELRQKWAVTVDSLLQAMLDESPTIVHFSGHGEDSGIILQDDHGNPKLVGADALASLFKVFRDTVQCVLLNSCFSTHQARAIRRHIPYVIGVSSRIPDSAAIAFSTGFYKALGSRLDIPFAFDYGKVALRMEGTPVESFPVLL